MIFYFIKCFCICFVNIWFRFFVLLHFLQVDVYLNLFKSEDAHRRQYNRLLNQCINMSLKKYNLSAESVIEYCESSNRTIEQGE